MPSPARKVETAEHTAGEWFAKYDTDDNDGSWEVRVYIDGSKYVLLAYGLTEANARQIAAVPEMLAALRDAVEHCYDCGGTGDVHFDEVLGSTSINCDHCAKQRAVIKLTTGAAP